MSPSSLSSVYPLGTISDLASSPSSCLSVCPLSVCLFGCLFGASRIFLFSLRSSRLFWQLDDVLHTLVDTSLRTCVWSEKNGRKCLVLSPYPSLEKKAKNEML